MKFKKTAAVAVLAATLMTVGATSAQATTTGYSATVQYIGGGSYVNVRTAPSLSATVAYRVNPGAPLSIDCQLAGGRLGSGTYAKNETWNRLSDGRYVHDVVTTTPGGPRVNMPDGGYVAYSSNIDRCGSSAAASRESKAAQWAQSQVGIVEFSGWCETLAEASYGTTGRFASADAAYWALRGQIHTDAAPPAGALVFYDVAPYGHVGISIGNGQVVSTKSPVNGINQPVRQHSVLGLGLSYRGWAYAPSAWPGR